MQAGRELRVMVHPTEVSDDQAFVLARNIVRKIENELQYPGQIRVTIVRETRRVRICKMTPKFQIPNSKFQKNSKFQIQMARMAPWRLDISVEPEKYGPLRGTGAGGGSVVFLGIWDFPSPYFPPGGHRVKQSLVVLDLEGVLVPEIWIAVAEKTGIPELRRTTRDEPDYDKLMRGRIEILDRHGLKLSDIQEVIATLRPLDGALEFLRELRSVTQVIILRTLSSNSPNRSCGNWIGRRFSATASSSRMTASPATNCARNTQSVPPSSRSKAFTILSLPRAIPSMTSPC